MKIFDKKLNYILLGGDMTPLAEEMKNTLHDKKIHIFGVDWGGSQDLKRFMKYYTNTGLEKNTTVSYIDMSMELDKNNEFRKIRNMEKSARNVPNNVKVFIAFEDQATATGISAASSIIGILYGMDNGTLPHNNDTEVYLATKVDNIGISHFSLKHLWDEFIGLEKYMEYKMPLAYTDLKKKKLLYSISDYVPEKRQEENTGKIKTFLENVKNFVITDNMMNTYRKTFML
jgi:hypothetical protein